MKINTSESNTAKEERSLEIVILDYYKKYIKPARLKKEQEGSKKYPLASKATHDEINRLISYKNEYIG